MDKIELRIAEAHEWLAQDQYPHGEWGRCEATNPTDDVRDMETSRIKPNVFTSSQAILSLISTGYKNNKTYDSFFAWLQELRSENGYWTSASGSRFPSGKDRGWSEVKNIRHTAKVLDLLMLRDEFVPADAAIIHEILRSQCENGAFPQHSEGAPDVWSTAYVMNMIIRCLNAENIHKSLPRRIKTEDWALTLRSHLQRARAWLCSELSEKGLWCTNQRDQVWITEAILSEIGGDLLFHRPDICVKVADQLINAAAKRAVAVWSLLIVLPVLTSIQQKKVLKLVESTPNQEMPSDTFEVSSYLKLLWLAKCPHMLSYYLANAAGHESALNRWAAWDTTEYAAWCVTQANKEIRQGDVSLRESPANKAEAWVSVVHLLNTFKKQIEESRGWELLWNNDGEPRDERSVQVAFWNVARPLSDRKGFLVREPETGAGPVDFSFANGFHTQLHIEFKLASSSRLEHGLDVQLPAYMTATSVDSAFYVIVGYSEDDEKIFIELAEAFEKLNDRNPYIFISIVYVDAKRRVSASRR